MTLALGIALLRCYVVALLQCCEIVLLRCLIARLRDAWLAPCGDYRVVLQEHKFTDRRDRTTTKDIQDQTTTKTQDNEMDTRPNNDKDARQLHQQ